MALRDYPALITQDDGAGPDAGYGVVFPDLPGCVSGGDTVAQAAEMAAEALALHVEGMLEDGLALPLASAPGDIPDWLRVVPGGIVATLLVPVDIAAELGHADLALDAALLRRIDAAAAAEGETRAGFLARAARELVERLQVA